MITEDQAESAVNYIRDRAGEYGKLKAERSYLQAFSKVLLARLFRDAPDGTVADREAWANAHTDYETHLIGLKAAQEYEEKLKWKLEAARIKTELWRTQEASARGQVRAAM